MVRIPCLFCPFSWGFFGEVLALRLAGFARDAHQIAVEAGRHSCHALNISEGGFQPTADVPIDKTPRVEWARAPTE